MPLQVLPTENRPVSGTRETYLDVLKLMLTTGMIFSHVVQFMERTPDSGELVISNHANLVTFAGFMFAFGIGFGLAPSAGRIAAATGRWRAPVMLFAAYCLSSFAYIGIVAERPIAAHEIADVILMRELYGHSEFLATFFLFSLVICCARSWLSRISGETSWLLFFVALGIAATTIDNLPRDVPFLGATLGSHQYFTFPLVQYFPWFLVGTYYARKGSHIDARDWGVAFCALAAFTAYGAITGHLPERFPPSILWIAGPAFFLLIYLKASRAIARAVPMPSFLLLPGRHVLFFLVTSNIVLFAACRWGRIDLGLGGAVAVTLGIMLFAGLVLVAGRHLSEIGRRRLQVAGLQT